LSLWSLLLVLVPVAAFVFLVWSYRKKEAERAAASAERLQLLLVADAAADRAVPASDRADDAAPRPAPVRAVTEKPEATPPAFIPRERMLTPPQALLYYLLKTTLTDHEIFPRVTLASVLESTSRAPSLAGDANRRLAQHTVDFVVSDKSMHAVAVVEMMNAATHAMETEAMKLRSEWVAAAGVRYVRVEAQAMPRRDTVRALILGGPAAA
jgi:hypothetical protein